MSGVLKKTICMAGLEVVGTADNQCLFALRHILRVVSVEGVCMIEPGVFDCGGTVNIGGMDYMPCVFYP